MRFKSVNFCNRLKQYFVLALLNISLFSGNYVSLQNFDEIFKKTETTVNCDWILSNLVKCVYTHTHTHTHTHTVPGDKLIMV
jgi:hypothetical protein